MENHIVSKKQLSKKNPQLFIDTGTKFRIAICAEQFQIFPPKYTMRVFFFFFYLSSSSLCSYRMHQFRVYLERKNTHSNPIKRYTTIAGSVSIPSGALPLARKNRTTRWWYKITWLVCDRHLHASIISPYRTYEFVLLVLFSYICTLYKIAPYPSSIATHLFPIFSSMSYFHTIQSTEL